MSDALTVSRDSVVLIYHGGRLPTWYDLTPEERKAYEQSTSTSCYRWRSSTN